MQFILLYASSFVRVHIMQASAKYSWL